MPLHKDILKRLDQPRPNIAVEHVVECALMANPDPADQMDLVELLISRNKRAGWVTLIKAYQSD